MNTATPLRTLIATADRRVVLAGATLLTTALIGGLALAAPRSASDDVASAAAPVSVGADETRPADSGPSPTTTAATGATTRPATAPTAEPGTAATSEPTTGPVADDDGPAPEAADAATGDPVPVAEVTSGHRITGSDDAGADEAPVATTTTVVPDGDALEPTPGPDAGAVVTAGAGLDQPTHATVAPTMTIVDLDKVEDDAPPPDEPEPVPVPGLTPPDLGITSNAFGCQSNCITHALLTDVSVLSANVELDLVTKVDAGSAVWVSEQQPVIDEGEIVVHGWPNAMSGGYVKHWQTVLELDHDTTYWITLRVEDTQGNVRWAITDYTTNATPTPDQYAANGDGCYFQCITFGKVEFRDTFDTVDLVIGTNVPASEDVFFDVAVSTDAIGWIGDQPMLPNEHLFVIDQDGGNDVRGHVSGLAASTTYRVLVKATDEDGYTAHAIGEFTTDPAPPPVPTDVRVSWHRVFVHHDGDTGAWGKGELSFTWGMADGPFDYDWQTPYTSYGWTNEDKIGDGTSIQLGCCNHHWVSVFDGESIPDIAVTAHENDTHGNSAYEHCLDYRQRTYDEQTYQSTCMTRTNVAFVHDLTIDQIEHLPRCWEFDVAGEKSQDYCMVIESLDANDKHAQFDALISFHVAD